MTHITIENTIYAGSCTWRRDGVERAPGFSRLFGESGRGWLSISAAATAMAACLAASPARAQTEVERHVAAATALAGSDLKAPLFLCRSDSGRIVRDTLEAGSESWLPPTRLFDNLYYIGNRFVGVLVVRTSQGLVLFDATGSAVDAERRLIPGLRSLGLDPAAIRFVIVSHGHWDHFGGAKWLQDTYRARIGLSEADWRLIEAAPPTAPSVAGRPRPRRDLVVSDGQVITLGDTSITLRVTPGHTPGTVSALIPAREGERTHLVSVFGSVAFPHSLDPTRTVGGLRAYQQSVRTFAEASRAAGADAIFNTHVFADGSLDRLAAIGVRPEVSPNPFLIGAANVGRYYGVLDACLSAAIARPHDADDALRPTVPPKKG